MSLSQIKGRTTDSEEEFNDCSLSTNSYIYTTAVAENIEEFSIEITLGDGWNHKYSEFDKNLRKIEDSITINRHGSIVVEIKEDIKVPYNKYGIVLPTGSLFLSRGVLLAPAKIEPAFHGKLKLRIFNTTQQKIILQQGDKLGSVIFFSTEATKKHDTIFRSADICTSEKSHRKDLLRWLSENKSIWIGWILGPIISCLLSLFLTYFLYYKPVLESREVTTHETDRSPSNR